MLELNELIAGLNLFKKMN